MTRYWALAFLALLPGAAHAQPAKAVDKELRIEGKLTKDDPVDPRRMAAHKVHVVTLKKGTYTIDMMSTQFDTYLFVEDKKGKQLDEDDDSGGNQNSRIVFNCTTDGDYRLVCTAFSQNQMGDYILLIKKTGGEAKVVTAHSVLVSKAAPDFAGDFALNGKAGKLSDLKGKVVLLHFWSVLSPGSVAAFPKLQDWHKAHKKAGLEVVGVTFWQHEVGQRVGFDAATGKLTRPDEATKATEQKMLKEFAEYHKVEHLLTTLPREDALKAFNAYGVNGFSQFVLIDRQGVIRVIRIGEGEATLTALEAEIKKALEEK